MFDEFDRYIFEFTEIDYAVDYWYDEGADIAEKMLCEFQEDDWKILLETLSERQTEWKKRRKKCACFNITQITIFILCNKFHFLCAIRIYL